MTLRYRLIGWLYGKVPKQWMHSWCYNYAHSIGAQLVTKPQTSDFTIVPHRTLTVLVDNDAKPITMHERDLLCVQVKTGSKKVTIDVNGEAA